MMRKSLRVRQPVSWPDSPPRPERLLETIHRLTNEGKIWFTRHALDVRMPERGFDITDVTMVLLNGRIAGDVKAGAVLDDWICKMVGELDDTSRKAGVVTVVRQEQRLLIVTTEWEDV